MAECLWRTVGTTWCTSDWPLLGGELGNLGSLGIVVRARHRPRPRDSRDPIGMVFPGDFTWQPQRHGE